jgi:hypothetical protein
MAIQGMAPDVIKLSSSSLFQLLFPVPVDCRADDGDSLPSPGDDRADTPGETFVLSRSAFLALRRPLGTLSRPWQTPPGRGERSLQADLLRSTRDQGVPSPGHELIHALCRLLC